MRPASPPAPGLAESIPPSARRLFDELGCLEAIEAGGFFPNRGNSVWWAGHQLRQEAFAENGLGFHTDRAHLERVLVNVARDVGVTIHERTTARSAEKVDSEWSITCDTSQDGAIEIRAPWVVDATGRHGFLAREGREPDRSTTTLALVRRWSRPDGWPEDGAHHTMVESYADGWAWSVPLSDELRCFTAMVDQRHADLSGADVASMLDEELAKTRHIGAAVAGAVPVGDAWACPASLYTSQRFGRRGLLLAGDAGSFIDPLSSFGVKKALSSGWLAGVVAHTALTDSDMIEAAVAFFDAREREVYQRYREVSLEYFQSAADAHGTPYWIERADAARRLATSVPDAPASLSSSTAGGDHGADPDRVHPTEVPEAEVRAAFDTIRNRPVFQAEPGETLSRIDRPGIQGQRLVMQEHLRSALCPEGIRYVRGVDLSQLVEVAPLHSEVPDGWAAYNGVAPPVTLPDYLTALATAFAAGILQHPEQ